jgi:hypothetical protein
MGRSVKQPTYRQVRTSGWYQPESLLVLPSYATNQPPLDLGEDFWDEVDALEE